MRRKTILILCLAVALCGCQASTSEVDNAIDTGSWQCRGAPDIHLRLIDYTDELAYCEISVGSEVGAVSVSVIDFANMVNDGHWQRIATQEPMLLPPPPNWDSGVSDKLDMGVRINGTDAMPMFIHAPLPVHDQITNIETLSTDE